MRRVLAHFMRQSRKSSSNYQTKWGRIPQVGIAARLFFELSGKTAWTVAEKVNDSKPF